MKQTNTKDIKLKYEPSAIELKWQAKWELERLYQPDLNTAKARPSQKNSLTETKKKSKDTHLERTKRDSGQARMAESEASKGKPFYNLMMFPYPSAEGLHVGSMYAFGGADIYARFKRLQGYQVFEPIGLDGFGIHSENHAIKTNTHPIDHAKRTEENFYRQLHATGNSYAWENKVETYDPEYYKWTQWLFVQLFNANLAYKKKSPVNFCPSCKTVLSDEQVIDGKCERCSSVVEKKELEQWFFKITQFAERLLNNIETLDWSEKVKSAQRNWIGKRIGSEICWEIVDKNGKKLDGEIITFTTRRDTIPGVTFIVLAPESHYVKKVTTNEQKNEVATYISQTADAITREKLDRTKTGVFTGSYAKNPFNGTIVPIYVADYVLGGYGTGAVMGMPGHDSRDRDFAKLFDLPTILTTSLPKGFAEHEVYTGSGRQINSGKSYDGLPNKEAGEKIFSLLVQQKKAFVSTQYHLRDWLISRQRYWGPPIPMIYCETCAKRKPKILLIHGFNGSSRENWFPWFKQTMGERGYEVLIPDLPDADNPDLDTWLNALKKLPITKEDKLFVVGHSLGGPTACQFIIKTGLQVEKLILIAPTGSEMGEKEWKQFKLKHGSVACKRFNKANTNLEKLPGLVKERVLYLSDNDQYIPLSVENTYKPAEAKVVKFVGKGHFNEEAGYTEFADILGEFPATAATNAGWHPVPEKDLPVKLPYIENFKPLGTGKAPLANHPEFYETTCPKCGNKATRETDVSDTFLDSAWYFLRYLATDWNDAPFPSKKFAALNPKYAKRTQWLPVTTYIGGAEHSVLHLLYARFTTMALHDMGYLDFEEPFTRFYAHGLIIKDGAKMSKSKGNVINPDKYIAKYGADTLRTYLLFLGPFNHGGDFRDSGIDGMSRFVKRVWKLYLTHLPVKTTEIGKESLKMMHATVKGVTEDMEQLRFNTAIAKLMIWYNFLVKQEHITREELENYLKLFAPFMPHLTEELWQRMGNSFSIHTSEWPNYDNKHLTQDEVIVAIQVNGKLRGTVVIATEEKHNQELVEKMARDTDAVNKFLAGDTKQVIYIPGKIINFVMR